MDKTCICHRTTVGEEQELNLHVFTDGSIEFSPVNGGRMSWMRFREEDLLMAIAVAKKNARERSPALLATLPASMDPSRE